MQVGRCTSAFALVRASLPPKIFCSIGQKTILHSSLQMLRKKCKSVGERGNNFAAFNRPRLLVIVCLFSRACENSRALLRDLRFLRRSPNGGVCLGGRGDTCALHGTPRRLSSCPPSAALCTHVPNSAKILLRLRGSCQNHRCEEEAVKSVISRVGVSQSIGLG